MSRRVRVPAADDLFRPSVVPAQPEAPEHGRPGGPGAAEPVPELAQADEQPRQGRSSGRVRHDEKMTVYVTSDELIDLEHARLSLRRDHGLALDRGRIVREAVALALADLEANGGSSALVQRLSTS